ncbi:hypothetical protein BU23DRAFT_602116 [Bimuria novae-zelandiae CBS 107.79]|uniref:Uncharacterized protein n=1 Tax=Bimuria novae-zelandiae CBS 107.79 TaxID=1447943 RepID=A0A6A5UVP0_9PLEO|nr:hypothetical protein BU23DRAFT_602116 [Bimuria novae-zelandiae CBS 107.79]
MQMVARQVGAEGWLPTVELRIVEGGVIGWGLRIMRWLRRCWLRWRRGWGSRESGFVVVWGQTLYGLLDVKSSLVRHSVGAHTGGVIVGTADYALTALLRCLVYELDADLAMVSLLDETTQYFLAGASRANVKAAQVTLESTRWYGCDTVLHAGGLGRYTLYYYYISLLRIVRTRLYLVTWTI